MVVAVVVIVGEVIVAEVVVAVKVVADVTGISEYRKTARSLHSLLLLIFGNLLRVTTACIFLALSINIQTIRIYNIYSF